MQLRFWGVRGSLPIPGPDTLVVGGNTTCVSVEHDNNIFVFDAGSGIHRLGEYLEEDERSGWTGAIFLSHYHWDHIQGLPFFAPAFRSENRFHLFGEEKKGLDLYELLAEQMQAPYFPVSMEAQQGLVTFNPLEAGDCIDVCEGVQVKTLRLNHPNGAIGYRLEAGDLSVCIITDHEHPNDELDWSVVEFARHATILIHEAQYDPEEKRGPKSGWGHSSWQEAAQVAEQAGAGMLFLSHHDPARTDTQMIPLLSRARRIFDKTEIATEATVVSVDAVARGDENPVIVAV
ncbi:MAG: MBL fold metallo-hydrolase [Anderseniella sp.]|nr:MBL fold metallo-hydrolase [Anderseniella sp.]